MPPHNDGGSPVTNYVIESKASSAVGWSVCNIGQQVSSPHFTAFGLIEGTTYQFRVSAENRVGRSEASHPTDAVVVREPISEYFLLISDYSFDSNFKLTLERVFQNKLAMFRSASTYLEHSLVVCDLTQIPAEGSGCRCHGGQLVSLIMIHCGAVLLDVDGLLDFTSVPLLVSA